MPILMIGTRRSGSNLLRLMLNQLPGIAAPHPPHIMMRMMPLAAKYGDLKQEQNFALLVNDVCRLVELNPVPWEGVRFDRTEVAARCRNRSVVALFGAVYDTYAKARGARTWVCKSLENLMYLSEIERCFPSAQYIHLYRDGRDVAVSFRKVIVGEKHFYHIAKAWAESQRLALRHRAMIPPKRFASVSYEELTSKPEDTLPRLCNFLGVPYQESILEFYKSEDAKRTAKSSVVWSNVVKPVMSGNTGKFLREASEEDIRIFESVAGDMLDALGYERVFVQRGQEREFTDAELRYFNDENRRLKGEAMRGTDAEDLKRRDRQDALLVEISRRPVRDPAPFDTSFEGILQTRNASGIGGVPLTKK
jgi:hypothetical protein